MLAVGRVLLFAVLISSEVGCSFFVCSSAIVLIALVLRNFSPLCCRLPSAKRDRAWGAMAPSSEVRHSFCVVGIGGLFCLVYCRDVLYCYAVGCLNLISA